MEGNDLSNEQVQVTEKKSTFKEKMLKRVSTLWGGIMISGVALLLLLIMLIIWLAN